MPSCKVKLELASRNVETGDTLYTFVLRYPRYIHSEIMTHRVASRGAASSRAIPCAKLRRMVLKDPATPWHLGQNQKGMQAGADIVGWKHKLLTGMYNAARYPAVAVHWLIEKLGAHKQFGNRLLEPWMWIEVIFSATELDNFFALRCHKDAEPHFQELARKMQMAVRYADSLLNTMNTVGDKKWDNKCVFVADNVRIGTTQLLKPGEWHTPFIDEDIPVEQALIQSPARCCRVSYLLPESGTKSTLERDKDTYDKLVGGEPIHASPFEHVAMAEEHSENFANFKGFRQLRYYVETKKTPPVKQ